METKNIHDIRDYIIKFQGHCDRYLSQICNPNQKSILIVGSGWGTEILWCLRNNANCVLGLDIAKRDLRPLQSAIELLGIKNSINYSTIQKSITDALDIEQKFDLVLSNNVFEHISDIKRALFVCSQLIKPTEGRIAIFTDPLYYSSCGSHLPIEPWAHLYESEDLIKSKVNKSQWYEYQNGLNKMTVSDFLKAITENNLIIHKFEALLDRNFEISKKYLSKINLGENISKTDLFVEGIMCELSIPVLDRH